MIKFETINRTLYRMVEPTPLTLDATFPCVVTRREDGDIGRYTKWLCKCFIGEQLVVKEIIDGNVVFEDAIWAFCELPYLYFEIIGYPVEEGSAEWALYQMMQGDIVIGAYWGDDVIVTSTSSGWHEVIGVDLYGKRHGIPITDSDFLFHAEKMGWQLYKEPEPEPKPLLADAKVGDLCQRSNGRYTQFHSKHKLKNGSIAYYFTDASGSTDIDGNHCIHECGNNIVSCEPLATEGTVEWAGQMLKLGKMVKHENNIYPHSLDVDGKVYYCHEYRESQGLLQEWIIGRGAKTGWQIYKEPELKYKVGDWVEIESSHTKGKTFVSVIKEMPNQEHYTVRVNSYFGGYTVYGIMERQIVRKLKPSEIIVRIGGLSGTVRPVSTNGIHIWFHLIGVDDKTIATIRISCLDTPTRKLVDSLLKAQEEEK